MNTSEYRAAVLFDNDKPPAMETSVEAWVDGGCSPNPGFGAWAARLTFKDNSLNLWGIEEESTNQRAELLAAIHALEALKKPCGVKIMSDSQYLIGTMNSGWAKRSNLDLWERLERLTHSEGFYVEFVKVKGHIGKNLVPHELVALALRTRKGGSSRCP